MEIKINKAFKDLTDVNALDDHKKIMLGVVSYIYSHIPMDNWIFFNPHDFYAMTGIMRFTPETRWAQKTYPWIFELFDFQFHDYYNLGIRPKALSHRHGYEIAGKPQYGIEITDEDAIKMWFYLLGVFAHRDVIADFQLRESGRSRDAWTIDRSYLGELNHRLVVNDYNFK